MYDVMCADQIGHDIILICQHMRVKPQIFTGEMIGLL